MSTIFEYRSNKLVKAGFESPVWRFESALDMNAQDKYSWEKGCNEYLDNCTANYTKDGLVKYEKKEKIVTPWKDSAAYRDALIKRMDDMHGRWKLGDVPTESRGPADPKTVARRALAASLTEEEIALIMAARVANGGTVTPAQEAAAIVQAHRDLDVSSQLGKGVVKNGKKHRAA